MLSVVARTKEDREAAIVEALTAGAAADNQASRIVVAVIALSVDHRGAAVKRGNRVAVVVRAVESSSSGSRGGGGGGGGSRGGGGGGGSRGGGGGGDDKNWVTMTFKVHKIINSVEEKAMLTNILNQKRCSGLLFRICNHRGCHDGRWILSR